MCRSGCASAECSYTPTGGAQALWKWPVRIASPSPASSYSQSPSHVSHLVPQLDEHQSYQLGMLSSAHCSRSFCPKLPVNVFSGMGCRIWHRPSLPSSLSLVYMGLNFSAGPLIEIVLSHQLGILFVLRVICHVLNRIITIATNVPLVFANSTVKGTVLFPIVNCSLYQVVFLVLKLQCPLCVHLVTLVTLCAVESGFAKRLNQVIISCLNVSLQTRACYTSILINQFIHTSLLLLVYVYIIASQIQSVNQKV